MIKIYILHPGTKLVIAFSFLILALALPLKYQAIAIPLGMLVASKTKPSSSHDPSKVFIRLWLIAGISLFLIHCIGWDGGFILKKSGLNLAGKSFLRIGALMVTFSWLAKTINAEELYAMLIDIRLPIKAIYVLFQAVYLIPRFGERAKEILLAQQARGFVLKGIWNRVKAYILILSPLFSTMVYEMEENAAVLSAKGLHAPGKKTHITQIKFSSNDLIIIFISIFFLISFLSLFL